MNNKRILALILLLGGLVILVLSLAADALGIGREAATFGWAQIAGTLAGAGIAVVGAWLAWRK